MTFISHRGAAGLKKENSLEAIMTGHSYNPNYVEVDVHHTKDGVFVIYHGSVKAAYLGKNIDETFKSLKNRLPEVLTLKDFMQKAPKRPYMLDIKIRTANEELIKELKKMPRIMRAVFASPHPKTLEALKKAFPDSKTYISQPYQEGPIRPLDLARQYNFDGICLNKWWIGPFLVRACKMSNKKILTYTVDRGVTMKIIKKFFPEVTIITNRPDRYKSLFIAPKKLLKK